MAPRPIRVRSVLLALALALLPAACQRETADRALLAAPAVGDRYAARLDAFSEFPFHDADRRPLDPAYGLLAVVAVDAGRVVLLTGETASPDAATARRALRGDAPPGGFDEAERIVRSPADLIAAYEAGLIQAVRRPAAD